MPNLPKEAFNLSGGCFCKAIRYAISVPPLAERPKLPVSDKNHIGPHNEVTERLPQVEFDHCNSCRRIQGSLIHAWIILPQAWTKFSLLIKSGDASDGQRIEPKIGDYLVGKPEITEKTYVTWFSSSEGVNRTFCARCGTHMTFFYSRLGGLAEEAENAGVEWQPQLDISTGTLDDESLELDGMRPTDHVHLKDTISWMGKLLLAGEHTLHA